MRRYITDNIGPRGSINHVELAPIRFSHGGNIDEGQRSQRATEEQMSDDDDRDQGQQAAALPVGHGNGCCNCTRFAQQMAIPHIDIELMDETLF